MVATEQGGSSGLKRHEDEYAKLSARGHHDSNDQVQCARHLHRNNNAGLCPATHHGATPSNPRNTKRGKTEEAAARPELLSTSTVAGRLHSAWLATTTLPPSLMARPPRQVCHGGSRGSEHGTEPGRRWAVGARARRVVQTLWRQPFEVLYY